MEFGDGTATKKCYAGDVSTGLWRGSAQDMWVKGSGFFIYVRRVKAGYRSYVSVQDARGFAQDFITELFQSSNYLKAHGPVSGYDIATFSGKLAKAPHADSDCFVFLRYGGVINAPGGFSGTPGYANGIYGGYCQKAGPRAFPIPPSSTR
jgi:hypothetical protein